MGAAVQQYDKGTIFRYTVLTPAGVADDVSDASTVTLRLEDQDGNTTELAAGFLTDGTDGIVQNSGKTTLSANQHYLWHYKLTFANGDVFHTEPLKFFARRSLFSSP